ncbi:bifunctional phosphopantothenoylcysteine decarboxylase/phosphopantothenate--cysteine ligase CoaBC [Sphingosinicella sp.]|uniref:bifunctional phosphopantothenoylcysteine decarboxylase/phosphopantothenate--cysteine ligase CoaBC n=1 Tax=Sphingosinicella sp. TaxID=1917971 RepID=UPI0035AE56FE
MGKRILLIISGGIAAYKALALVRLLRKDGIAVRAVLTQAAQQFVTPLSLGTLTEDHVYTDLFDLKEEREIGHIQLSRQADLVVVAPATANILAKMAGGIADDLATTLLLATDKPVLAAPAMNVRMWLHPATQRNVAQLRVDGITIMEPDDGDMACGEYGPGRLPEPEAILASIRAMLAAPLGEAQTATARFGQNPPPLRGKHVLVTAGPTHEPIDPVRYIANRSSGKQGFAIAGALAALGADVTLVAGPVTLATPPGVRRVNVETAREMAEAVETALPVDAAVMVAAVADWRAEATGQKIKKDKGGLDALPLVENPDILAGLSKSPKRPGLVIGFAAETETVVEHAKAKLARKGCDWIVANDVSGDVMGGARNRIHIVSAAGVEDWPDMEKDAVARRLAQRIANELTD